MGEVEWGPAVTFLAAGLVVGALILWRVLRKAPAAAATRPFESLERRDLLAKLDGLVAQLRELEDTGGKRTAAQHRDERFLLELQAARTLLAVDALSAPSGEAKRKPRVTAPAAAAVAGEPAEVVAAAPARGTALAGFFWGVGSAAALGLLFFFVSQSSKERPPGGSVTGNTPMEEGGGPAAAPADGRADIAGLEARVRQDPEDLEARLDLARLHLMRQDMMAVYNETRAVLQRDPGNARATAYQSLVRLAMGQADEAEKMLIQALSKDPNLLEGYLHLMFVYTSMGKPQQAEATMKRATERFPDRAATLGRLLAQMRAAPAEKPAAGAGGPASGPAAASASAGGGRSVSGVIDLDAAARAALRPGAIVFVMLRESGFGAGPPLAARRLPASDFPLAFEIGQGDAMAGGQVPDDVLVEARLDSDGDPITRPRSDPYGREDNVKIGTRGLRLVLSPRPEN